MKKLLAYLAIGVILSGFLACVRLKKSDAEIEREQWISGFTDSIAYYQQKAKDAEESLTVANQNVAELLNNFEMVKNPREVSGYYLLKGWEGKLPFTSTAVYARINENEKLEIIATLAGSTFNQIAVGIKSPEFYSEIMPHDQAFNFRHERFNSVYFTGGKADTIAEFIAANNIDKLKLEFIENGKKKKDFIIPENEKNMIFQTWDLYYAQNKVRELQKELWICSKKIEYFRHIMDKENKL